MTKTKKLRIAIYIRKSSDEKTLAWRKLADQEKICRDFCLQQGYDMETLRVYKDNASAGLPAEKRSGLRKLLEDATNKEFDVVVVHKVDRLARNLRLLINITHDFSQMSIAFRSATEPFDTTTSFGKANLNLLGAFAEFERNTNHRCPQACKVN